MHSTDSAHALRKDLADGADVAAGSRILAASSRALGLHDGYVFGGVVVQYPPLRGRIGEPVSIGARWDGEHTDCALCAAGVADEHHEEPAHE